MLALRVVWLNLVIGLINMNFLSAQNNPLQQAAVQQYLQVMVEKYHYQATECYLVVSTGQQKMYLVKDDAVLETFDISSSKYGVGSESGSNKTPAGLHRVKERFGDGAVLGTIFRARANTGEVADIITDPTDVETDHVTSRILWLEGMEPGVNKGGDVDSYSRYIYIHGTHEEGLIGTPQSHGCIRMYNADVIELYEQILVGTFVIILDDGAAKEVAH